jgi:anion-transporting  ArsA/GET3 family ATPase
VFEQQLVVVSGKGGVGKTVMASAIATICARRHRTMLASFDPHVDRHPLFGVPLGYEPVEITPSLSVMRVEALAAIREYVRRKMPFAGLYDAVLRSRMFRDFAGAAPGFEELMCLGKLYDLVTDGGYERVVFDAPSTGHLRTLIDVPAATLKAVLVGPLNHNARKIQDLLMNPERTRVVLASLPEEMAVREALELEAFCRDRRMRVGPVIVNQCVPDRFAPDEVAALTDLLAGFPEPTDEVRAAVGSALAEHQLAASQIEAVAPLAGSRRVWTVSRCIDHEPDALLDAVVAALDAEQDDG